MRRVSRLLLRLLMCLGATFCMYYLLATLVGVGSPVECETPNLAGIKEVVGPSPLLASGDEGKTWHSCAVNMLAWGKIWAGMVLPMMTPKVLWVVGLVAAGIWAGCMCRCHMRRQRKAGPVPAASSNSLHCWQPAVSYKVPLDAWYDMRLENCSITVTGEAMGVGSSAIVFIGTVSRGQDDTAPACQVAVKVYASAGVLVPHAIKTKTSGDFAVTEISVLLELRRHPDLVDMVVQILAKGSVHLEEDLEAKVAVLELCQGSLEDDLKNQGCCGYKTPQVQEVIRAVLKGVAKLHELNITHRDLKPGNVFITSGGKIKIGDFGSASRSRTMHLPMGSHYYTAPEAFPAYELVRELQDNPEADMGPAAAAATAGPAAAGAATFDHKVDVWSVGTMVLHLYAGSPEEMVGAVTAGEDWNSMEHEKAWLLQVQNLASDCPDSALPERWRQQEELMAARSFIRCSCRTDPAQRLEAKQLLEHKWLQPVAGQQAAAP